MSINKDKNHDDKVEAEGTAVMKANAHHHIARSDGHLKSSSCLAFQQHLTLLMLPPY